jgi:UDP-N-acetylglucosamine--N-acetylmuramyl-(pentapeptide) pyrophosphoryl-undecaprenol N-acetylglucosamine transferase
MGVEGGGKLEAVLFAGGGTGGHVYMAVALAQLLEGEGTRIGFAGTAEGLESRILPPLGYALDTIRLGGLKNVGWRRAAQTVFQLPSSLTQSLRIVRRFRPSVIVGVGGYASGPVIVAGRLLRIPSLLLEPNVHPGFTNRLLRPMVEAAAVAFEETGQWFGTKARVTGIPVRRSFFELPPHDFGMVPMRVLVFGGSRGSRPLNRLMCEALPHLPAQRVRIVHQTGPSELAAVREAYRGRDDCSVVDYIEQMAEQFREADLIVSRAGASTVAEIAAAGRPALLVPFPQAADDHQRKNALAMERRGAALLVDQETTSGSALAARILALEADRTQLARMAAAARRHARPDAALGIVQLMKEVAG